MPIDPALIPLTRASQEPIAVEQLTAATVRDADLEVLLLQAPEPALHAVEDVILPSYGHVRLYRPKAGPLPTLIYFHGGGFVIGRAGYEQPLRELALSTGWLVAAPTVRLAPEHPFPAAADDAVTSAEAVISAASLLGGRERPVAIAGDSSGGNLAAVATRLLTRRGVQVDAHVLIYPMLDATANSPSYRQFATGCGFTKAKSLWYLDQYLPRHVERTNPRVSPLFESDLCDLPPTLVITAEYDPLRDEGEQYAEAIQSAGGVAAVQRYDGMIHGFFQMTALVDTARTARETITHWLTTHARARAGNTSP